MLCVFVRRLIQAYLGDALRPADARRVHAHCERCASCAAALREARATARLVSLLPRPALPPEDLNAVLARVRARGQERLGERLLGTAAPMPPRRKPLAERASEQYDACKHAAAVAGLRAFGHPAALPVWASAPVAVLLLVMLYQGTPSPERAAELCAPIRQEQAEGQRGAVPEAGASMAKAAPDATPLPATPPPSVSSTPPVLGNTQVPDAPETSRPAVVPGPSPSPRNTPPRAKAAAQSNAPREAPRPQTPPIAAPPAPARSRAARLEEAPAAAADVAVQESAPSTLKTAEAEGQGSTPAPAPPAAPEITAFAPAAAPVKQTMAADAAPPVAQRSAPMPMAAASRAAAKGGVAARPYAGRDANDVIALLGGKGDEACEAARELGRRRQGSAVKPLTGMLNEHAESRAREAAADALAAIGTPEALAALRTAAEGDGPGREPARRALARVAP